LLERAPRFADLLDGDPDDGAFTALRRGELIGRPLGAPAFLDAIGRRLGRNVAPGKRGPKPKAAPVASKRR
jgi:putative transposase